MAKVGAGNAPDGGSGMEGGGVEFPLSDSRDGGVIDIVDPATLSGGNGSDGNSGSGGEPTKRKRGRPAGSGSGGRGKPTQTEARTAVKGIEPLLLSLHKGIAGLLKSPEFELDADEAKMLSENMVNVASQYSVEVNPKYMAWLALIGCLMAVYGPRFGAMAIRKHNKKQPQQSEPEAPMRGGLQAVPVAPFVPPQSFTG